ncbi:MAG: ribonuclease III [Cyanobacteriota bacterium]
MHAQRRRVLENFLLGLGLELPPAASAAAPADQAFAPINEALSHTSAALPRNHERLEFLGDAVLRLAAAELLQQSHPSLSVGQASALRAQLVSDRWLAELAETIDLDTVLLLGPAAAADRAGRATVLAESCEALVGGLYEAWGGGGPGLAVVKRWLSPHWQRTIAELQADPERHNWKSALQEWSQARKLGQPCYRSEERSQAHGDPRRFLCRVDIGDRIALAEGYGGSRRQAEQEAARQALAVVREDPRKDAIRPSPGS